MTPQDADRIIAEFMGVTRGYYEGDYYHENYSESLDALVPVWKALEFYDIKLEDIRYDRLGWTCDFNGKITEHENDEIYLNIFEAAAMATAKAILELKEKE